MKETAMYRQEAIHAAAHYKVQCYKRTLYGGFVTIVLMIFTKIISPNALPWKYFVAVCVFNLFCAFSIWAIGNRLKRGQYGTSKAEAQEISEFMQK